MINPQLMGLNNFENVPNPKDLWKDEKQKYRHWIILFGIGLLVVLAFYLTGSILNLFDKENILQNIRVSLQNNLVSENQVNNQWITNYLVFPSLIISLLSIGLILYVVTITKSYLQSTFARISLWSIYVIGFGALFSFVQIITYLASKNFGFVSMGSIFIFINSILFIVVYFTSATKVNRIRRQFVYAEYVQKLKKDDRFIKLQENLQSSLVNPQQSVSPFAPGIINPSAQVSSTPVPDKISDVKLGNQYNKLKAMSITKLKEVASQLSISGVELMKKDELIATIIRVSSSK